MSVVAFSVRLSANGTYVASSADGKLVAFGDSLEEIRERLTQLLADVGGSTRIVFAVRGRPPQGAPPAA
jgi:hypothetical protein